MEVYNVQDTQTAVYGPLDASGQHEHGCFSWMEFPHYIAGIVPSYPTPFNAASTHIANIWNVTPDMEYHRPMPDCKVDHLSASRREKEQMENKLRLRLSTEQSVAKPLFFTASFPRRALHDNEIRGEVKKKLKAHAAFQATARKPDNHTDRSKASNHNRRSLTARDTTRLYPLTLTPADWEYILRECRGDHRAWFSKLQERYGSLEEPPSSSEGEQDMASASTTPTQSGLGNETPCVEIPLLAEEPRRTEVGRGAEEVADLLARVQDDLACMMGEMEDEEQAAFVKSVLDLALGFGELET